MLASGLTDVSMVTVNFFFFGVACSTSCSGETVSAVGARRHPVHLHRNERQFVAVQPQRLARPGVAVPLDLQRCDHPRIGGIELEGEISLGHPVGRLAIILQAHGLGLLGSQFTALS